MPGGRCTAPGGRCTVPAGTGISCQLVPGGGAPPGRGGAKLGAWYLGSGRYVRAGYVGNTGGGGGGGGGGASHLRWTARKKKTPNMPSITKT
eukprot:1195253-Prorocentrum_minimum.AAC.3